MPLRSTYAFVHVRAYVRMYILLSPDYEMYTQFKYFLHKLYYSINKILMTCRHLLMAIIGDIRLNVIAYLCKK